MSEQTEPKEKSSAELLSWVASLPKTVSGETIFPKPSSDVEWRELRRAHQGQDSKGVPRKSGSARIYIQEPGCVHLDEEGNEVTESGPVKAYWLSWGIIDKDTMSVVLYEENSILYTVLWETSLSAWRTRYDVTRKQSYVHAIMEGPTTPEGLERRAKVGMLKKVQEENQELKNRLAAMEEMLKALTQK